MYIVTISFIKDLKIDQGTKRRMTECELKSNDVHILSPIL